MSTATKPKSSESDKDQARTSSLRSVRFTDAATKRVAAKTRLSAVRETFDSFLASLPKELHDLKDLSTFHFERFNKSLNLYRKACDNVDRLSQADTPAPQSVRIEVKFSLDTATATNYKKEVEALEEKLNQSKAKFQAEAKSHFLEGQKLAKKHHGKVLLDTYCRAVLDLLDAYILCLLPRTTLDEEETKATRKTIIQYVFDGRKEQASSTNQLLEFCGSPTVPELFTALITASDGSLADLKPFQSKLDNAERIEKMYDNVNDDAKTDNNEPNTAVASENPPSPANKKRKISTASSAPPSRQPSQEFLEPLEELEDGEKQGIDKFHRFLWGLLINPFSAGEKQTLDNENKLRIAAFSAERKELVATSDAADASHNEITAATFNETVDSRVKAILKELNINPKSKSNNNKNTKKSNNNNINDNVGNKKRTTKKAARGADTRGTSSKSKKSGDGADKTNADRQRRPGQKAAAKDKDSSNDNKKSKKKSTTKKSQSNNNNSKRKKTTSSQQ